MSAATVRRFGQEASVPCLCGCGSAHRAVRGEASRANGSEKILFFALLAACGEDRHLWLAVGSGPWDPADPRDSFCSVEIWKKGDEICSRVTDAAASPWKRDPIFENVGALLDRNQVMEKPGAAEWLFGWTDDLTLKGWPPFGELVLGAR